MAVGCVSIGSVSSDRTVREVRFELVVGAGEGWPSAVVKLAASA